MQYQLDDPGEYYDEHITVIGSGDAGIEKRAGPRRGRRAEQRRHDPEPLARVRARQESQRRPADGSQGAGEGRRAHRNHAGRSQKGRAGARNPRRHGNDSLRPDHRAYGVGAAAQIRRKLRDRVHERGPRSLSQAVAGVRKHEARHLRHRRAGRLSAYQALHEPGPRRHRVHQRQHRAEARGRADTGQEVRRSAARVATSTNGWNSSAARSHIERPVAAADARIHARQRAPPLPQGRRHIQPPRTRQFAVRDRRGVGGRGSGPCKKVGRRAHRRRVDLRRGRADIGASARRDRARGPRPIAIEISRTAA